jgi:putative flippase GtrA
VLSVGLHWDVFSSRAVSFTCATFVTWLLNRKFTFRSRAFPPPRANTREYSLYLVVQVAGATLNFGIFGALLVLWPVLRQVPVIPLSGGAVVALFFNFAMLRRYVFRDGDEAHD